MKMNEQIQTLIANSKLAFLKEDGNVDSSKSRIFKGDFFRWIKKNF